MLNRVLSEYKPEKILELGLGESTKFISAFLENELNNGSHKVIEEDENWKRDYLLKNKISSKTEIFVLPVEQFLYKNVSTPIYSSLENILTEKFELYIIDGPKGSNRYSRFDMVQIAKNLEIKDDFIFIIDDYERSGEQESVNRLISTLKKKNIEIYTTIFYSLKQFIVIGSKKYIHTRSF